jgi:protein ImuB
MRKTSATGAAPKRQDRAMVLWCPDWPITAAILTHALPEDAPVALIEKGRVFACSASARREGVKRGLRLREAQARCPVLLVYPYDPLLDSRHFEPVLSAIEEIMPGIQLLRPGMCVLRARGPARFYGGEEEAALWLLDSLDGCGIHGSRIGIADGPFTAERAARLPGRQRIRVVPEGEAAGFLAPLPIGLLDDPPLVTLARRLGIRTLGEFATLPQRAVRDRFGETGALLHSYAGGQDSRAIVPRLPPRELDSVVEFWPALDRVDQVAFGVRASADRFIAGLVAARLVCTAVRVEVSAEGGELSERSWLHPHSFSAADVVDRVRWQLQGNDAGGSALSSGVIRVRLFPESVDAIGNHEAGLWGSGPDERIHHGLSRVQSRLGHGAVLTAVVGGGRNIGDRQILVPWGDRTTGEKSPTQPWPGHLPEPLPTTIFPMPALVCVFAAGAEVDIDDRGMLSAGPETFSPTGAAADARPILGWAGPWPIEERWWDADASRSGSRFQVIDADGTAWLLLLEDHRWWAEARYD